MVKDKNKNLLRAIKHRFLDYLEWHKLNLPRLTKAPEEYSKGFWDGYEEALKTLRISTRTLDFSDILTEQK